MEPHHKGMDKKSFNRGDAFTGIPFFRENGGVICILAVIVFALVLSLFRQR